jgi:uncharacterized protein (TIRG00374 family)
MKYKSFIFLGIGLLIMAVMLWFIGIDRVLSALKYANILYVIFAIILEFFAYFLYTLRWEIINKMADKDLGFKKLLPMVLVSLAVNNITPSGRGGGEPVRAYLLTKEGGGPFSETFATVIADRALDTFPFIILAVITIVGLVLNLTLNPLVVLIMVASVIAIIIVVFLIVYMSINQAFGEKITKWLIKLSIKIFRKKNPDSIRKRVTGAIHGFQDTMRVMIKDKNIVYYALPLSFFIWFVEIFRVYVVFLAFGSPVSPILIGEVFIVASLIGMIPLLPGGLGAVDGVMILLYATSGISPSMSAAATVIERLISFWMTTVIGFLVLPFYGADVFDKITSSTLDDNKSGDDLKNESNQNQNESVKDSENINVKENNKSKDNNEFYKFFGDVSSWDLDSKDD